MNKLAGFALIALGFVTSAQAQSLAGSYQVDGKNADGTNYSGKATISITSKTACRITWQTAGTTSAGTCMRIGRAFAASYKAGGTSGMAIYELQADGSLNGAWTIANNDGLGSEILTPLR